MTWGDFNGYSEFKVFTAQVVCDGTDTMDFDRVPDTASSANVTWITRAQNEYYFTTKAHQESNPVVTNTQRHLRRGSTVVSADFQAAVCG